jgi:GNAT superfamily N-acetyltransferase
MVSVASEVVKPLSIRRLWSTERELYSEHLKRLDAESRHSRFTGTVSDTFIDAYVSTSFGYDMIVYGAFDEAQLIAVGELRLSYGSWPLAAETAFSVEKKYQDHGLGDMLLNRVIIAAQNRGVQKLDLYCLGTNTKMRHLAQKHRATLDIFDGDTAAHIEPASFNPVIFLNEVLEETSYVWERMGRWPFLSRRDDPTDRR